MPAYTCKNRVLNMPDFSICLMQYTDKVTVQIIEQLSRQEYSKHCQTFKIQYFAKKKK